MLNLKDVVHSTPCLVLYFGQENDFMTKVTALSQDVNNPDGLEFECFKTVADALNYLYTLEEELLTQNTVQRHKKLFVYGLIAHLRSLGESSYASITAKVISFYVTGRSPQFAEDEGYENYYCDQLLYTTDKFK